MSEKSTFPQQQLNCIFCGKPAKPSGRWSGSTVICTVCGMETETSRYEDQIEAWKDEVCRYLRKNK